MQFWLIILILMLLVGVGGVLKALGAALLIFIGAPIIGLVLLVLLLAALSS